MSARVFEATLVDMQEGGLMTQTDKLAGATALITGGSGAIGEACALTLLADGATVVLLGRREDKLNQSRARLQQAVPGGTVEIFPGDALCTQDVEQAAAFAYGLRERLDIVLPTVGGGAFKPLLMQDLDGLRNELDLNIGSAFLAVRHAVPYMRAGGSIVCISSTAATMPFPWLSGYCAGKAGLEAFIRCAADELASAGVRLNAVRPGLTRSEATSGMFASEDVLGAYREQIPLGRTGEAGDIAAGVRYLAGPESSWVTGQCFNIDGGQCLRRHPDMTDAVAQFYGEDALAAVMSGQPVAVTHNDT